MKENKHIGTDFDSFLQDEGILDETEAAAVKRVIAFQIRKIMQKRNITKAEMARRMHIKSRMQVDRLLDPANKSVTLLTLEKAASALGKKLRFHLV